LRPEIDAIASTGVGLRGKEELLMPLTPSGRRDAEIEKAVHEWNLRHVVKLSGSYGLSARHRSDIAEPLEHDRKQPDRARVVADVWREGLRSPTARR
jgi:hypothetical protein